MKIHFLREEDVVQLVPIWNQQFVHDVLDEARFRRVILEDLNYEPEDALVAVVDNDVVGCISTVVKDGVNGRDGAGRGKDEGIGYIKCLFTINGPVGCKAKERLLQAGLAYLKSKDIHAIIVGTYTGQYFFPGVDVRYTYQLAFYESHGFVYNDYDEDVTIDLVGGGGVSPIRASHLEKIEEMGISIVSYSPEHLPMVQDFVPTVEYSEWFPFGWEDSFGKGENKDTILAVKGNVVIGWVDYHVQSKEFGPIAVRPEYRRKGIGSALLVESCYQMQARGVDRVVAGWANTPFYVANGWHVCRTYWSFTMILNR
ncbi:MAG: GNAT family N-acetyltransferase [Promethearchaeota archaeon]